MSLGTIQMEVFPVTEPVAEAGWYITYGYGIKPLVLYAAQGQRIWRDGMRSIPVTSYAGPVPERAR